MRNNTCRLPLVACHLLLVAGLFAKGPGTTTASFLKIAIGARNIAMGETGAVSNDVNALYWNPAGLSLIKSKHFSFMHAFWLEDISYEFFGIGYPTGIGVFGLGLYYLHMTPIQKYDRHDRPLNETYRPSDLAVTICYARKLLIAHRILNIGLNLKYISSRLDDETPPASAFAVDLGSIYQFTTIPLSVGLTLQNMGTEMKFIRESDPLPMNIKLGCSYLLLTYPFSHLLVSLDINKPIDNDIHINIGTEYSHKFGRDILLALRVGYKTNTRGHGVIYGLTAGVGFSFKGYSLDYAFVPYSELGNTHRISLVAKFDR